MLQNAIYSGSCCYRTIEYHPERMMIDIVKQYRQWFFALFCAVCAVCIGYEWCFPKYCHVSFDYSLSHQNTSCRMEAKTKTSTEKSFSSLLRRGEGRASFRIKVDEIDKLQLFFSKFKGKLDINDLVVCGRDAYELTPSTKLNLRNITASGITKSGSFSLSNADKQHSNLEILLPEKVRGARGVHWSNLLTIIACTCFLVWSFADIWSRRKLQSSPFRIPKLANIEFLRIVFTLMVVLRHIALVCPSAHNTGEQGVQFFFLLSGYLLFLTYRPERSLASFAANKLIRFVPLVILGCVLCGAGVESLKCIFCLQGTGLLTRDVALNEPAWYIAVLFWCSLFYFAFRRYVRLEIGNFIIATLVFVLLIVVLQSGGGRYKIVLDFYPLGLLDGIVCMGLGYLMAQCCVRPEKQESCAGLCMKTTLLELVVIGYVFCSMFYEECRLHGGIWMRISHIALLYLFVMKRGYISSFFERPIFARLSRYCLAIYLTHWCVIVLANQYIAPWNPELVFEYEKFFIVGGMLLATIIGVLAHHIVEIPVNRFLFGRLVNRTN